MVSWERGKDVNDRFMYDIVVRTNDPQKDENTELPRLGLAFS